MNDILSKLRQIYAAIDLSIEKDLKGVGFETPFVVGPDGNPQFDFSGNLNEHQFVVIIKTIVHEISSFHGPCRGWFRKHSLDPDLVDQARDASTELKVLSDLDEFLKHGAERDKDGSKLTQLNPRLRDFRRPMSARSVGREVAFFDMAAGRVVGPDISFTVNAEIYSEKTGASLGHVQAIATGAAKVWEQLLVTHGFWPPP